MKSTLFLASAMVFSLAFLTTTFGFAPKSVVSQTVTRAPTPIHMGVFDGEQERQALTRDSEPEEYFQT